MKLEFESKVPKICVFFGGQLQFVGDFDFDLCFSFVQLFAECHHLQRYCECRSSALI